MLLKADDTSVVIQALFFRADIWSREDSAVWCKEHGFSNSVYRTHVDSDTEELLHHIFRQFDTEEAVDGTWRTISDTFPDGISASVCQRKEKSMQVKYTKGKQSADDPMEFIMSDESADHVNDVILAKGWDLKTFRKNPVALWGHDHGTPIGTWTNVRIVGKQLLGKLKLAAEGTSAEIDTIRSLLEQRIIKAVSVGFMPTEMERRKDHKGYLFIKSVLHECSLVAVPANPNSLAVAKSLGADRKLLEQIFTDLPAQGHSGAPAAVVKSGKSQTGGKLAKPPISKKAKPMDLATKIVAKKERLVAIKDDLTALKSLIEADDGYEFTDDEQERIDLLSDEEGAVVKSIESLEKLESGLAKKAIVVPGAGIPRARGDFAKEEKGGSLLIKVATAKLVAHKNGIPYETVLENEYGHDDRIKAVSDLIMKTGVGQATTTQAGWAAELVTNDLKAFLEELQPISVYANIRARGVPINFAGATSVTIPRRAGGALDDVSGSWVGEGGVIPVKRMSLGSQTLNRYKVAVISTFTNEIMEQSTPAIETLVRQAMLDDTAVALDTALMDASAVVAGVRPAGLLNGVTAVASAGATAGDIITDLKVLFAAMSSARVGSDPVLVMNSNRLLGLSTINTAGGGFLFRDEIAAGRLLGVPVVASSTVPGDVVLIIDAGSFASANDTPQFMVSDQTVLTMANADATAPTQAEAIALDGSIGTEEQVPPGGGISVAGGDAVTGTPDAIGVGAEAVSMYQTYSTALRMILPTSWGLIRTNAVASLKTVTW